MPQADEPDAGLRKPDGPLRRGWTTGACATAATKAALTALLTGKFPDPVSITLPKGEQPAFALATEKLERNFAQAAIIKDAGDDPDITHGAMICVTVEPSEIGIVFAAGEGVGTITLEGLPLPVGQAAINPVPRQLMTNIVHEICAQQSVAPNFKITVSIPGGEALAQKTWNPRLGIKGGLSILGTTGIVHPFSCSSWIHSIHRGIDVARAAGINHVLGSTGSTSEDAAIKVYGFEAIAQLDMGDFAGGLLKYLREHPIDKITIAGGFAKIVKLAQGAVDLHSGRSQVDMNFLAALTEKTDVKSPLNQNLKDQILNANTAAQVLDLTRTNNIDLTAPIADLARQTALNVLRDAPVDVEIMIVDRKGSVLHQTGFNGS
ncbi:cobalt-precorrin-5B (C(1))-methyltransferase [Ahrensia sp. 13_GOM-1096m]|uniref:cobalt-precorrin-5B (C(1))-methyltransferase n=1 Tax=Ahrensia sp. 13_GOM-1096m TaxID=1380380 RepID=UPI00054DA042|nr:cobalt-precorrin-5B (C(1))-methyltransferase [Ahrensia sp. 13_GOM-1096m]